MHVYMTIIIIVLQTKVIMSGREGYVTTIDSIGFTKDSELPHMFIQIPYELIKEFAGNETGGVRTISFLFYEVEHLFPNEIAGRNK